MNKTFIIWLVIVIHQISACAGMSFASCCSHEPCNLTDPGSDHVHSHPRIHFITHILSHLAELDEYSSSGMKRCSCDSPIPDSANQTACLVDSQSVCSRLTPRNQPDCALCFMDLKFNSRPLCFPASNTIHIANPSRGLAISVVLVI